MVSVVNDTLTVQTVALLMFCCLMAHTVKAHSEKLAVELLHTILSGHDVPANTGRALYRITGFGW